MTLKGLVKTAILRDGSGIILRPICPEDEPEMARFHGTLSDRSVHFRYFYNISLSERISHERLKGICFSGAGGEVVVAESREGRILGVGRLSLEGAECAEFALIVSDAWQDRGVGAALLEDLIAIARAGNLRRLIGFVLADNASMLDLCRRLGFDFSPPEDGVIQASLDLDPPRVE
jgi:acetyltransferase